MDIDLFDFTTPRSGNITDPPPLPPSGKQARRKREQVDRQKEVIEDGAEILHPPPNKTKRASPSAVSKCKTRATHQSGVSTKQTCDASPLIRSDAKEESVKCTENSNYFITDIKKEEITQVLDGCGDTVDQTVKCSLLQTQPSPTVDDARLQNCSQSGGLLRGKLLRLASSAGPDKSFTAQQDVQPGSQPPLPTITIEPAAESEDDDEDTQAHDEKMPEGEGEKKPNSESEAGAESQRDMEEELLSPDITCGRCSPTRDSQNSMLIHTV